MKKEKPKRANEEFSFGGGEKRIFETREWDVLVRGVGKQEYLKRANEIFSLGGGEKKNIWNERMRCSRQGGGVIKKYFKRENEMISSGGW